MTRYNKCGRIGTKWLFFFIIIEECCVVIEKKIDKKLVNRISYQIWYKRYLKGTFGKGSKSAKGGPYPLADLDRWFLVFGGFWVFVLFWTGPNPLWHWPPVYQSLHALVGLNMFIVLSSVMTCIKCRLSSSLFFLWLTLTFQWEFNFNGSLNIGGVREKLNFVCALDAMVGKLISLICFDIFQSKWYRNALIGMPDDKTNSEKRLLWQTLHVWLKNVVESSLVTILINASMNDNE